MTTMSLTRSHDPNSAGRINFAEAEIDFSAAAARVLIDSLPAGAIILRAAVEIVTAFNAGTSNLVTIGFGAIAAGTADDYVPTVTEGTPGIYTGAGPFAKLAAAQDVYLYYTPGAGDASTGKAYGYIEWVRTASNA